MTTNGQRLLIALAVGTGTLVPPAVLPDERTPDCRGGGRTQFEMNACAGQRADASQKRLASLLAELDRALPPHERQGLAALQARWLELRDLDCTWERGFFEGGSVAPMAYATCIANQTDQRIERLKIFLCEGAGMTGPCEASGRY
jgi:uncharacterized protein YecT (DUF1311 family)